MEFEECCGIPFLGVASVDPSVECDGGDADASPRVGGASLGERELSLGIVVQFLIAGVVVANAFHVSILPGVDLPAVGSLGCVIWNELAGRVFWFDADFFWDLERCRFAR